MRAVWSLVDQDETGHLISGMGHPPERPLQDEQPPSAEFHAWCSLYVHDEREALGEEELTGRRSHEHLLRHDDLAVEQLVADGDVHDVAVKAILPRGGRHAISRGSERHEPSDPERVDAGQASRPVERSQPAERSSRDDLADEQPDRWVEELLDD